MEAEKTAEERANDALRGIAQNALDATGGDVWGTQPQPSSPPAEATEAAPEAAPPTDPPVAEPTSQPAPVFGKYRSLEEAERGYHEAVRMGNEAKAEAEAARFRLDAIERTLGKGPTPEPEQDPLEQIENYGVPKELIAKAIDARFEQKFDQKFGPAIKSMEADQAIVAKYPEYQEKFAEVKSFVETQPEIKQQIEELNRGGNYLAARQIAYLNWKVAQTQAEVAKATEAATVRETEVKDARADAGVGKPRRAESRTPSTPPTSKEENQRLIDLYKAGHTIPYLRAKLDPLLPPDFDKVTAQLG